ncbi:MULTISPECIES: NUDIX domain-containing protein [unclassified Streptomyces]|uniref:NUDIX domain-containing protein n=1 Tax=unclassified Streptomyces TaxID=2593676 RepID=UPI00301D6EFE
MDEKALPTLGVREERGGRADHLLADGRRPWTVVDGRADNGTRELPGGILELNETPEAGVAREVWEETGMHVEVDQLTGVYKNTTRGIVALVFRCKPSGGTERTSSESTAVSWLTPDEVSERMAEVYAVRLLDALDGNGPHVRSHDGKQLITAG